MAAKLAFEVLLQFTGDIRLAVFDVIMRKVYKARLRK